MKTLNYSKSHSRVVLRYDIKPKRDRVQGADGKFFRPELATRVETGLQVRTGGHRENLGDGVVRVIAPKGQRNVINFNDAYINPDPLGSTVPRPYPIAKSLVAPAIDVDLGKKKLSFDGRTVKVNNFSVVVGSRQDDRIVGDKNNNVLNGNAGADTLIGRGGNDVLVADYQDTLTGGAGRDRFRLSAAQVSFRGIGDDPSPNSPNVTITDFQSGHDRIQLSRKDKVIDLGDAAATKMTLNAFESFEKGRLSEDQLNLIESNEQVFAGSSDDGFYYNTKTGDLFLRGSDVPIIPVSRVAKLTGAPTLKATDIVVI